MICDGVTDLVNALSNTSYEKDETKKVIYLIALLDGVEPRFLCILMLRMFTAEADLGGFSGFFQYPPLKKSRYCNTLTWL